ncbi:MAG: polysaccharide export protein [Candidatus Omnitrophica bacterium]|nr:polysaccharide export protein [Candidatus Omnitrophota bacterium]
MQLPCKKLSVVVALAGFLLATVFSTGCQSLDSSQPDKKAASAGPSSAASGRLRPGDQVTVAFSGVQQPPDKFEGRVKEDGQIPLPYIGSVPAAGKTTSELESDIKALYVPKFYVRLTVNVNSEARFFTVDGEVRSPSRQVYAGEMSVLRAIASAGGFTDFANKKRVKLIRADGRKPIYVNCIDAQNKPELDLPVYPGDKIIVTRRFW